MVQVMVNSHITAIWVKKSVTQEMHSVPRIGKSEHYSDRRIDMNIHQTLLIGFDFRGRNKDDKELLRFDPLQAISKVGDASESVFKKKSLLDRQGSETEPGKEKGDKHCSNSFEFISHYPNLF